MMMIYSMPIRPLFDKPNKFATVSTSLRCGRRLLLPLSFCILLLGCDSHSSSVPATEDTVSAPTPEATTGRPVASKDDTAKSQQEDSVLLDKDISAEEEGQSLIAAAKTDASASTRRTPMISQRGADSALQATLIGDYIGMLPCSSCNGIAVTLNLFADGSVLKNSIYENPEYSQMPVVESGIYRQDNTTITIVYENKDIETYRIQDNHLIMINKDKTLDTDYTLSRK